MKVDDRLTSGFIGLGAMGAPMAHNLYAAGRLAAVWNRSSDKLDAFVDTHTVVSADSPAAVARHARVVFTCVSADADLLAVIEQLLPGLDRQSVLVDSSTVSLETAREAARCIGPTGAAFLDAPVSGGVEGARRGTLAMMVGGDVQVLQRVRPLLSCMAARVAHMGPVGSGQATKAVNQIMCAGINQAVTEALAFAEAHALPMAKVMEVVAGGAAGNWFLEQRGQSMVDGRYGEGFKVALHHKDLEICQRMAAALGVALPLVEMTLIHYRRLMQAGYSEEDISALFREKRALFQRPGRTADADDSGG
jgi:3-hydroxyisobutyrate dehydrogenase